MLVLLCAAAVCRPVTADDGPIVQYALDHSLNDEYWLTQAQPEPADAPAPEPAVRTRSRTAAARRRQSTYRAPSMFGDYFGNGSLQVRGFAMSQPIATNIPFGGGAVRRVKIAENNSSIPRDRFIFNYNFFNDVRGGIGDVNRYTLGFEKTCFSESSSVQVLFPFASTLAANQIADGSRSTDTQFGDLSIILKTILHQGESYVVAGGLGLTAPIGEDALVLSAQGVPLVNVENNSVHLQPFLGIVDTCDSGFYWQGFLQFDLDTGKNPVSADTLGAGMLPIGQLQDQTVMFLDLGVGYWLTDPETSRHAIAATAEVHYATALENADSVDGPGVNVTSAANRFDVVNLTLGASILVNESFSIRPAMVIPVAGANNQFDYEAMVQMNFWR
jgi:hypothetical protein